MARAPANDVKARPETVAAVADANYVPAERTGVRVPPARVMEDGNGERFEVLRPIVMPSASGGAPIGESIERSSEEYHVLGQQTPETGMVVAQKYELGRCLGQGGMGTVWAARDRHLDIEVAIKLVRRELVTPVLARRLLREARTAAKLRHPAIVRISDFGTAHTGVPFLVMELLQGETLSERIRRLKRLEPDEAVRLLLPIAHGLSAAHMNSVVHRDVKPANVFLAELDSGMQPKLLDFGVAKIECPEQTRLTTGGIVVGSPSYMSPEQARGLDADLRSDIWSFCVLLYEALTGVVPFAHANHNGLMQQIINAEPEPLCSFGLRVPGLWPIVERGLSKDPERRWQSMRALGRELAVWLLACGVTEDVTGRALRSAWLEGEPGAADFVVASDSPDPALDPDSAVASKPRQTETHAHARRTRWLRYGAMPAITAIIGGLAGWYLRTHEPGASRAEPSSRDFAGLGRSSPGLHLRAPPRGTSAAALATPASAAREAIGGRDTAFIEPVGETANAEPETDVQAGAPRDATKSQTRHPTTPSAQRSERVSGAGAGSFQALDIKTEF